MRIGFGFDVHQLQEGRDFWLGGIKIPAEKGIFKYELNNLPAENYKIELKSGSEKCTQVWKETIEFKAPEK